MTATLRLTTAQALVRFLGAQWSGRDGVEQRLVAGMFGIFGHGNVCGVGQALLENQLAHEAASARVATDSPDAATAHEVTDRKAAMAHETAVAHETHDRAGGAATGRDPLAGGHVPYWLIRNEQSGVHAAAAFARTTNRLQTLAVTTSIGPGATNMVTGAALATTNRLPVLLLPSDQFASRLPDPVLQQLESPQGLDVAVTDCFRPVSRFFDRITRPEQLIPSLLNAMRVFTDPADTGAVTLALPQDVQAQAYDWPVEFFARRVWHVARPRADIEALARAVAVIRSARRPLIVAGGGVRYSQASEQLRALATATGIPVADTHAGKGAINWDHPCSVGGLGSTGSAAANELARRADVVIGIGTRYSDFTTASHTVFADPDVQFVNVNTLGFDAAKHCATMVLGDAREVLVDLLDGLSGWQVEPALRAETLELRAAWQREVDACYSRRQVPVPAQSEVFGVLNELMGPDDILINAAGSMPGDLQSLWRASTPREYHVEYAYSCMGYEIPAALGARLALTLEAASSPRPTPTSSPSAGSVTSGRVTNRHTSNETGTGRECMPGRGEVVAIVGDGTYQMLPMEIATLVSEGLKVIIVLLQNHGFASIGALSRSRGSQGFGTTYHQPSPPIDLAANAASWGANVLRCRDITQFRENYAAAAAADHTTVLYIETDREGPGPRSTAWWDVPVAEVSALPSTRAAYEEYTRARTAQRHYLRPPGTGPTGQ